MTNYNSFLVPYAMKKMRDVLVWHMTYVWRVQSFQMHKKNTLRILVMDKMQV